MRRTTRRTISAAIAAVCIYWAQSPDVAPASSDSPTMLDATPTLAKIGQPVSFTLTTGGYKCPRYGGTATYLLDFDDRSPQEPISPNVAYTHVYVSPGALHPSVTLAYGPIGPGVTAGPPPPAPPPPCIIARTSVDVMPAATPAPTRSVPTVLAISLSWPDGSQSIVLTQGQVVPNAVGLVRVDAPGSLIVQWELDGAPIQTQWGTAWSEGDVRFDLEYPLTRSGSHSVSLAILSPAPPLTGATRYPTITYDYAGSDSTSGSAPKR